MTTKSMRPSSLLLATLVVVATTGIAEARQPLPDLSLEELMRFDAGRVYGASERLQPVTEAPASVSFITAEEIARYGYRTLADVLRSVRGMYITNDRNFSFLGARGFARPGDYNSRVLLLINGHRVNDNIFGQAAIGAEMGMDASTFERVEVIRGPASSLYGDSAFFGVVNVITRTGASLNGFQFGSDVGNLGTETVRGSYGQRYGDRFDFAVAGTVENQDGIDRLYLPEFDSPDTNNGIAESLDGELSRTVYGRFSFGGLNVTTAYGSRRRHVPTASAGTIFNEQEFKTQTTDRHSLFDAEYVRLLQGTRLSLRLSYDRFTYDGVYPIAGDGVKLINRDDVVGSRWTLGARATRALPGRNTLTAGYEFFNNNNQNQRLQIDGDPEPLLFYERSSLQHAIYAQDEFKPTSWLILNAGLRYDNYQAFSRLTPRTAVIVMPTAHQSFKYLFGSAFRAPNTYELNPVFFGDQVFALRPEQIDTHELVWERYTGDWLRTSVSAYWYTADRLIALVQDETAPLGATYQNAGQVNASGFEVEAQMRLPWRIEGLASYALQKATDQDTDTSLVNSPRHISKLRFNVPGPSERSVIAFELAALSSRQTLDDVRLPPYVTANVNVIQPLTQKVDLVVGARNLFDVKYADPGSSQNEPVDQIPQNGRTFRIGLRWNLQPR